MPEQDASLKLQCLLVNDEFAAMGRVGIITSAVAFLAGYNLRLLTVVQAMSQLDAVYGDKEARTFATNHGLQILFAPREQRDADEYSAMLGHFTERATSRGRSRSFSGHGHSTVSRNESEQRRALLLPQEFKELGSERLVVICRELQADPRREDSLPPRQGVQGTPSAGAGRAAHGREPAPGPMCSSAGAMPTTNWHQVKASPSTRSHMTWPCCPMPSMARQTRRPRSCSTSLGKGSLTTGGAIEPCADEDGVLFADDDGVLIGRDIAAAARHESEQASAS